MPVFARFLLVFVSFCLSVVPTNQRAPNVDFAQDDLDLDQLDQESKKETEEFVTPQVPVQAVPSIGNVQL